MSGVLAELAKMGLGNLDVDKLMKANSSDEYGEEMTLMADVRAYIAVAYKVSTYHMSF